MKVRAKWQCSKIKEYHLKEIRLYLLLLLPLCLRKYSTLVDPFDFESCDIKMSLLVSQNDNHITCILVIW
jgi:hypothetical protein